MAITEYITHKQYKELVKRYIKKEDLVIGAEYLCKARNFLVGTWNGEAFDYIRTKFGDSFPDTEYHWDDGAPNGTVKPLLKLNDTYENR